MNILMVAAENGALAGGKVGGLGDVIGEVPPALARSGSSVSVVTPSYGFLHRRHESSTAGVLSFGFYGADHHAALHRVQPASVPVEGVRHYVIDHPILGPRSEGSESNGIYCVDPDEAPFATMPPALPFSAQQWPKASSGMPSARWTSCTCTTGMQRFR